MPTNFDPKRPHGVFKFCYLLSIGISLYVSILICYESKNAWPVTIIALAMIIVYNMPKIFENVKIFKFGKEGVELEILTKRAHDVTKEAEIVIDTLKEISILLSEKISTTTARTGRWSSGFNIIELYNMKITLRNLLSKIGVLDENNKITKGIDEVIISDIFNNIESIFANNKDVSVELGKCRGKRNKRTGELVIDIDRMSKYLDSQGLINEHIREIIDEIYHFKTTGQFKNERFAETMVSSKEE